jgi:hypothetical protein
MYQACTQLQGISVSHRNNSATMAIQSESGKVDDIPQARCYCGWSVQDITRYNQLFHEIKEYQAQ